MAQPVQKWGIWLETHQEWAEHEPSGTIWEGTEDEARAFVRNESETGNPYRAEARQTQLHIL